LGELRKRILSESELHKRVSIAMYSKVGVRRYGETQSVNELFEHFDGAFGLYEQSRQDRLHDVLMDNPFRTVRQILDIINDASHRINAKETVKRDQEMMNKLTEVFTNPLARMGYSDPTEDLLGLSQPEGINALLDKLVTDRLLADHDDLKPVGGKWRTRAAFVAIQGHLVQAMRVEPGLALHYMVKICFFKLITEYSGLDYYDRSAYKKIKEFLRLDEDMSLISIMRRMGTLVKWRSGDLFHLGTVLLTNPGIDGMRHKLDSPVRRVSFWLMIGFLGDALLAKEEFQFDELDAKLRSPEIIRPASVLRNLIPGGYKRTGNRLNTGSSNIKYLDANISKMAKEWRIAVFKWLANQNVINISPAVLSGIVARFYNNVSMIDIDINSSDAKDAIAFNGETQSPQDAKMTASEYIYVSTELFLKSILLEECLSQKRFSSLREKFGWAFSARHDNESIDSIDNIIEEAKKQNQADPTSIFKYLPLFTIAVTSPLTLRFLGISGIEDTEKSAAKAGILAALRQIFDEKFGGTDYTLEKLLTFSIPS
jgi:hypothetical protein